MLSDGKEDMVTWQPPLPMCADVAGVALAGAAAGATGEAMRDIELYHAIEAQVAWQKGVEAGLKRLGQASLRGLVPSRLSDARAAWLRAGGR